MKGSEAVRFCGKCELNVYNLSTLDDRELRDLVQRTEGRSCARFYQRRDGTVTTRDCPGRHFRKLCTRIVGIAAVLIMSVTAALLLGSDRGPTVRYLGWYEMFMEWTGP